MLLAGMGAWAGTRRTWPRAKPGGRPASTDANCPSSNPPNELTLDRGHTADDHARDRLCERICRSRSPTATAAPSPAPPRGSRSPSARPQLARAGVFSTSGSNAVTVGADASGTIAAPAFTANATAGSYTVTASSQYGSVSFSSDQHRRGHSGENHRDPAEEQISERHGPLPPAAAGQGAGRRRQPGRRRDRHVHARLRHCQRVRHQRHRQRQLRRRGRPGAPAITGASGLATSPLFTANSAAGSFTATASVSGKEPRRGRARKRRQSRSASATPVSFSLSSLAGKPTKVAPGVGSTQSTLAGARSRSGSPSPSPTPRRTPSRARRSRSQHPRAARADALRSMLAAPTTIAPRLSPRHGQGEGQPLRDRRRTRFHRQPPAGRLHRQGNRRSTQGRRRSRSSTKHPEPMSA